MMTASTGVKNEPSNNSMASIGMDKDVVRHKRSFPVQHCRKLVWSE